MATILFEGIKDYPALHSNPYILKAIIKAIKEDLPGIGTYLNARMIPFTSKRLSNKQRKIKKSQIDFLNIFDTSEPYGVAMFDIAGNTAELKNQLFNN